MKVCPKCGKQYGDDANFCTNDAGRLIAMAASAPAAAKRTEKTLSFSSATQSSVLLLTRGR